jgi:membrane protein required for colicin V production
VVLQGTGDWLMSMLPDDPESTILKRLKKPKPEEGDPAPDESTPTPGQRSGLMGPAGAGTAGDGRGGRAGVSSLIHSGVTR